MIEYQLVEASPEDLDAFAAQAEFATVHCRTAYLETLGAQRFRRLLLLRDGKPLLATLQPLDETDRIRPSLHLFSGYQGLLVSPAIARLPVHSRFHELTSAAQALLTLMQRDTDCMTFRFHPFVEDLRAWQWFHYHEPTQGKFAIDLRYTGLIELEPGTGFDDYLRGIRSSKRRQYRLAQRAGMHAEATNDVGLLASLYRATFDRQGIAKGEEELFWVRRIAERAMECGFGELLVARTASGEPASATLFLHDAGCGYYLFGANDPRFRDQFSGIYCFAEALRRCHARGLRWVDVGGINSPSRGDFKIAFNAAPRAYFEARWTRATP